MYRLYGLLMPNADFTLDEAVRRLAARFPKYRVTVTNAQITLASESWEMEFRVLEGPGVQAEHAAIAEKIGGGVDASHVAACARRVEAWSETPDPEVRHFEEFLAVVEVLKSFQGVVVIDPKEPCFM
jgi:hypothetical protein